MESLSEAQFFQTVLRCVADGVFIVDCSWRITSFNKAAERITGVPAEVAIGKRCSEVFHADLCEERCPIRETMGTGREVIDRPARILNRRGRSTPISVSSAVLRAEDGAVLGAVETFRTCRLSSSCGGKFTTSTPSKTSSAKAKPSRRSSP